MNNQAAQLPAQGPQTSPTTGGAPVLGRDGGSGLPAAPRRSRLGFGFACFGLWLLAQIVAIGVQWATLAAWGNQTGWSLLAAIMLAPILVVIGAVVSWGASGSGDLRASHFFVGCVVLLSVLHLVLLGYYG